MSNKDLQSLHNGLAALLQGWLAAGRVSSYIVNLARKREHASAIFKGLRHTKAPEHGSTRTNVTAYLETPEGLCVEATIVSGSFAVLRERLEDALALALPLEHKPSSRKHDRYPAVPLASGELLAVFAQGRAAAEAARFAQAIEIHAARVVHPRLMSREVHASFAHCERSYFDSSGNQASEESALVSIGCVFWLSDTSEDASDMLGSLPTDAEVAKLVEDASRNLTQTEVRKLEALEGTRVMLAPRAFLSLLDDLVFPNFEARVLLRKTGAFEVAHIGERVVERLTLRDDPHKPCSPFSSCYDAEGTPTRPVTIIEDGVLQHPLFTAALLAELEAGHPLLAGRFSLTGHASSLDTTDHTNLEVSLEGVPETNPAAAIHSASQVVFVANLTGMSADPLTGQFALDSDGAKVYRDGRLVHSTSLTLRGNIREVLSDASARLLPCERSFNRWSPGIVTGVLSCVAKEMADDEDLGS